MPLDPRIGLATRVPEIMSPAEGVNLQNMVQQFQVGTMKMQEQRQQQMRLSALKELYTRPGATDPKTGLPTPETIRDYVAVTGDAEMGTTLAKLREQTLGAQNNQALQALQIQDLTAKNAERNDVLNKEVAEATVSAYDLCMQGPGASHDVCDKRAQDVRRATMERHRDSGRTSHLKPEEVEASLGRNVPIEQYRAMITKPKEVAQERRAEEKQEMAIEKQGVVLQDIASKAQNATERLRMEQERLDIARQKEEQKRQDEGGRAQVFTNRMVTSANEAIKDLENVVRLPSTVSRGWLGGRQQGPSLFDATKESLANTLTSEDVKAYQIMSAGIQRNLSTIEAVGLMPSGSLTHMMDTVVIKEGDTLLNKAMRLAQTRQILEGGLEPILANPRVPPEVKDFVQKMQDKARKAVPFTNSDILDLMNSKNPNATLGQAIGKTLGSPGAGARPQPTPQTKPSADLDAVLKSFEKSPRTTPSEPISAPPETQYKTPTPLSSTPMRPSGRPDADPQAIKKSFEKSRTTPMTSPTLQPETVLPYKKGGATLKPETVLPTGKVEQTLKGESFIPMFDNPEDQKAYEAWKKKKGKKLVRPAPKEEDE